MGQHRHGGLARAGAAFQCLGSAVVNQVGGPADTASLLRAVETAYYERDAAAATAALSTIPESAVLERARALWRTAHTYPIQEVSRSVEKTNEARRKALLDEAEDLLDAHLAASPDDADALLLLSQVYQTRITGMMSGMRYGRRAGETLERAFELAPENPQVLYHKGVNQLMVPGPFGDRDAARLRLREAVRLFEADDTRTDRFVGGYAEALAYLGLCLARDNDTARAKEFYEKALAVQPGYVWVKEELLPDLP